MIIEVYIDSKKFEENLPRDKEFLEKLRLETRMDRLNPDMNKIRSPTKLPKIFDITTLGYTAVVTWNDLKTNHEDNILRQTLSPSNLLRPHNIQNKALAVPSGRREV